MTDLNEVRKYLMRSAKEADQRAQKMRAEASNMTIEADRYERESVALATAAQALEQSATIGVPTNYSPAFEREANLDGGAMLGGIGNVTTGGFRPVPRMEKPAPWDHRKQGPDFDPMTDRG